MQRLLAPIATVLGLLAASAAQADIVTFAMRWGSDPTPGAPYASGLLTVDTALLPVVTDLREPGFPDGDLFALPNPAVKALSITVGGAGVRGGTFGAADFDHFWFWTRPGLDLTRELIGQRLDGGLIFGPGSVGGTDGVSGEVGPSVSSITSEAPSNFWWFTMGAADADGGCCVGLTLSSMAPLPLPVPEPGSGALLAAGLAAGWLGLGGRGRLARAGRAGPLRTRA